MDNFSNKKFVESTYWIIIQNIFSILISLVVGSLSARYLGPSNYGLLDYGSSIISFFLSFSTLGLESVLVVEMIKREDKQGLYLGTSIIMRLLASITSFLLIILLIKKIEPDNDLLLIVVTLQSTILFANIYEILLCWFQTKLQMKYVSIATIISLIITSSWRIYILSTKQSVILFALNSSLSSLITGAVVCYFYLKKKHPHLRFSTHEAFYLIKKSYPFLISNIAITLYSHLDKIMIGNTMNTFSVGLYSAALTIASVWQFIPFAIINTSRPILLEDLHNNQNEFLKKYRLLLLYVTIICFLFGIIISIFSKIIISILYGNDYADADLMIKILVWSIYFAMIGSARSIWVVGFNMNRFVPYFTICGVISNVLFNYILIPKYGTIGAAISTTISQFIVAMIAPSILTETREFIKIYISSFYSIDELIDFTKKGLISFFKQGGKDNR